MKAGKIWGQTELIHANGVLEFHRIEFKGGYKCSEHEHRFKWNGFFVESGKMLVRVWQKDYDLVDETILGPGDFTLRLFCIIVLINVKSNIVTMNIHEAITLPLRIPINTINDNTKTGATYAIKYNIFEPFNSIYIIQTKLLYKNKIENFINMIYCVKRYSFNNRIITVFIHKSTEIFIILCWIDEFFYSRSNSS